MSQQTIDLLSDSIRARSQAGARAGRYVTLVVLSVLVLVVITTHLRLSVRTARGELLDARQRADHALSIETTVKETLAKRRSMRSYIERYQVVAPPIEVSRIIATLVDLLPEEVSLDRLDIDMGLRAVRRGPRFAGTEDEQRPQRILSGDCSGIAPDDDRIAELVTRISSHEPFRNVSLDFSRGRSVDEVFVREFRVSFEIDLDRSYTVRSTDPSTGRSP